jgi:hypothetical protein
MDFMDQGKRLRLAACLGMMLILLAFGLFAATRGSIGWAPLGERTVLWPAPLSPPRLVRMSGPQGVILPQKRTNNPFDELRSMHESYTRFGPVPVWQPMP